MAHRPDDPFGGAPRQRRWRWRRDREADRPDDVRATAGSHRVGRGIEDDVWGDDAADRGDLDGERLAGGGERLSAGGERRSDGSGGTDRHADGRPLAARQPRGARNAPLPPTIAGVRYGYGIGVLGVVIVIAFAVLTIVAKPKTAGTIAPGERVPVFAAPLIDHAAGPVDTAVKRNEDGLREVPACKLRGTGVLNICELYERGPVVLALFFGVGSCPSVLSRMQRLAPSFPGVSFVAVALHYKRSDLKRLLSRDEVTLPVAYDEEGILAALYRSPTCPQVSFIDEGGVEQSKALLTVPSAAELRKRVAKLVAASAARVRREASAVGGHRS